MTGANQAALSFSLSIAASAGSGSKLRWMESSAAVPEHGDAGQIERADMIERADHQQPRVGVQPEHQRLIGRLPVDVLVGQHHALGPVGRA